MDGSHVMMDAIHPCMCAVQVLASPSLSMWVPSCLPCLQWVREWSDGSSPECDYCVPPCVCECVRDNFDLHAGWLTDWMPCGVRTGGGRATARSVRYKDKQADREEEGSDVYAMESVWNDAVFLLF
mmetsp:Transcript_21611/g.52969  ORF Transcript_21611/g.52969 Transcript_21611/m.52969 type:complete len:126 (-) Transcript_21611:680-1057(-)